MNVPDTLVQSMSAASGNDRGKIKVKVFKKKVLITQGQDEILINPRMFRRFISGCSTLGTFVQDETGL